MFAFVFAGFETTAAALAWTFALLGTHPDALARAQQEIDVLKRSPTEEDVEALPFIRACWDEAQRVQSLPYYSRDSLVDQELNGYYIPAGSVLLCSPHALQYDPRYWEDPEKFKPQRWLDSKIVKNAFLPFGIGERRCLGVNMANIEGVLFLAKVLKEYNIKTQPGWTPRRDFHMSTTIHGGLPVTIMRRKAQTAPDAMPQASSARSA